MGFLHAKAVFTYVSRAAFNSLYRLFGLFGRRDEVLFVSRKSGEPSYDYVECGKAFSAQGYELVYLSQHFKKSSVLAYAGLVLRELYHLARCRVCVIDRYDPVISLLDFKCEPTELRDALHLEFPSEPIVIQLWHAFGAFKKFGYQALDIAEGHSSDEAALFRIHRNNSWVICSGEGARKAFAEAFACPIERVLPLGRPEYRSIRKGGEEQWCRREVHGLVRPYDPQVRQSGRPLCRFARYGRPGIPVEQV